MPIADIENRAKYTFFGPHRLTFKQILRKSALFLLAKFIASRIERACHFGICHILPNEK